jgi:hypothetical protein
MDIKTAVAAATIAQGRRRTQPMWAHPVAAFVLLSAIFGMLTVVVTPPLRGPDEPAHFMRAYALLQGEVIPSTTDAQGRKGIFIPLGLERQMALFERPLARHRKLEEHFSFPELFAEYARLRAEAPADDGAQVFKIYAGSDGYSPVPYLPYLPVVALAHPFGLDFLSMLYVMRTTGLVLLTAVMAYAIAIVPHLQWAFVLIAMLPSALYSRAVLSADASALAFTMVFAATCLRGADRFYADRPWERSLWMTLCALSKPPQIAFIMLEAMRFSPKYLPTRWKTSAIVIFPAVIFSAAWTAATSADVAAWRMTDGTELRPEHFEAVWKLRFMLEHPWHFPVLLARTYHYLDDYWLQLIGILGWLDTRLHPLVYPWLSLLLLAVCCEPLGIDLQARRRVAAAAAVSVLGYSFAVFLIFYLVWTGLDAGQIDGVQGRYFVAVLPVVAMLVSALVNRGLPGMTRAWAAIFGAILSGSATLEAVLRVDWKFAPF